MGQNKVFEMNLPVQAYRDDDGKITIVNYMPRKNRCSEMTLEEFNETQMSEEDLFYGVATNLLNLAILFVEFAQKKRDAVYYHSEDVDKHFPPLTYANIALLLPFLERR